MDADNKLYELLNVQRNATDAEIKKVFKEKNMWEINRIFIHDEIGIFQGLVANFEHFTYFRVIASLR